MDIKFENYNFMTGLLVLDSMCVKSLEHEEMHPFRVPDTLHKLFNATHAKKARLPPNYSSQ